MRSKKFNDTKPKKIPSIKVDLEGMSFDEYMRQTFGCDETLASDLPDEEATLSIEINVLRGDNG